MIQQLLELEGVSEPLGKEPGGESVTQAMRMQATQVRNLPGTANHLLQRSRSHALVCVSIRRPLECNQPGRGRPERPSKYLLLFVVARLDES